MHSSISHEEIEIALNYLNKVKTLPVTEQKNISKYLRKISVKKGDLVLAQDNIERRTKLLVKGVVHQYKIVDDKIMTTNIVLPGITFSSIISYNLQVPSEQIQEAISDTEIIFLDKEHVDLLLEECPTFCYIYLRLYEKVHLKREIRANILHYNSADKRYELFVKNEPQAAFYIQQVPQKLIASYLGLSPESFSRAKRRYLNKT